MGVVHAFLERHYSSRVGESPAGHAIAIVFGTAMMITGIGLALSIIFLPLGSVIGLLGLFIFAEGLFAHIQRPLKLSDLLDALVGLTIAAITLTFALGVVFFLVTFGVGTFASILDWLQRIF